MFLCRDVIKADVLEETVLSAVIKHLSLADVVRDLAKHEREKTEEYHLLCDVMAETYRKLYALIRQLQVRIAIVYVGVRSEYSASCQLLYSKACLVCTLNILSLDGHS